MTIMLLVAVVLGLPAKASARQPRLSSVYVEIKNGRCAALDKNGWTLELDALAAIGVAAVVTKNSVRNPHKVPGHYEASYPSQLEWVTARTPNDSVDALLSAADAHPANFSVHLGHFEDHVWFNKTLRSDAYLRELAARAMAVQTELHKRYSHHPSFVGSYDPQETNAMSWIQPDQQRSVANLYLGPVWAGGRALGLETSCAPFFSPNTSDPARHSAWWSGTLDLVPPRALTTAFLDDDLATNFWTIEGPLPFFEAAAKVMRAHGVAVWSDAVDHTHDDVPAPTERFVEQLQAEASIVDSGTAFTTFEWCYYFSPNSGARQKALYDGYARYLNSTRGREYSLKSEYERGRLDRTHERRGV